MMNEINKFKFQNKIVLTGLKSSLFFDLKDFTFTYEEICAVVFDPRCCNYNNKTENSKFIESLLNSAFKNDSFSNLVEVSNEPKTKKKKIKFKING